VITSIANILLASPWRPKILVSVSLRRKNFVDTFWRPHFSIWRLKKNFQSPVGACLKKLISDPVGVTADENWLFVAGILVAGLYVDPPILFLIFVMSWSLSNCNRKSCKKSDHEKFVHECPQNAYCLSYYLIVVLLMF